MKKLTIRAYDRTALGGKHARKIIRKGYVPGVLYGGNPTEDSNTHFYLAALDIKPLRYEPFFIDLHINDKTHPCILQSKQVHPVSEIPIHVDLLRMEENKPITMEIPVRLVGKSVGVAKGGLLVKRIRKLRVQALPKNMPEKVILDVSKLDLGQSVQVKATPTEHFIIRNAPTSLVATIEIPRALRSKKNQAAS